MEANIYEMDGFNFETWNNARNAYLESTHTRNKQFKLY